jgi:predicted naringenin-chalcone synthase
MSLALLGIGTAVPSTRVTQKDSLGVARSLCCRSEEHETWLPAMYAGTGIDTRHLCLGDAVLADIINHTKYTGSVFLPTGAPDETGPTTGQRMQHYAKLAPPLAVAAAASAVSRSGLSAGDLTHLVTISCTGFVAPGLDVALIRGLDLRPTIQRTHVGYMGCHGALNGLRVARAFTSAEPKARVLLCAVELCTLHYHYGWRNPGKVIANALFSDGAAAVVGVAAEAAPTDAWQVAATGSCLIPDTADAMTWTIGDHGFEMTLSKQVPGLIARHLQPWLEEWLAELGTALAEVQSWAIHPGGPRILSAVEEGLNLSREAAAPSRAVFAEHGNMSSPTILFILERLRGQNAKRPCVALGFGPGLMAEAALLR